MIYEDLKGKIVRARDDMPPNFWAGIDLDEDDIAGLRCEIMSNRPTESMYDMQTVSILMLEGADEGRKWLVPIHALRIQPRCMFNENS